MQKLSENDYLEFATKDVNGEDLLQHVSKKYPTLHPLKQIDFLSELFNDKKYQKLVANLIVVKLQRIRSQVLKQIDELMSVESDIDVLKSLDKLLAIVLRFSKFDKDETKQNKIIIQYTDGKEETFNKQQIS